MDDFKIPQNLDNLWRYMKSMYELDAFGQSVPADQDIINHYKLQQVNLLFFWLPWKQNSNFKITGRQSSKTRRTRDANLHNDHSIKNFHRNKNSIYFCYDSSLTINKIIT